MSLVVIIFRIHRWFLPQIRMLLCQSVVWKKSLFLYFSQVGYSRWRLKSLKNWTASWMNLHMRSLSSHLKNKLDSTVIPIKDIQTGLLTPCVRQLFVFILLLKCWYYILNLIPFCPLRNFAYSLELYLILHFFLKKWFCSDRISINANALMKRVGVNTKNLVWRDGLNTCSWLSVTFTFALSWR